MVILNLLLKQNTFYHSRWFLNMVNFSVTMVNYSKWIYYGYRPWFLTKLPWYLTNVNKFYYSNDINTMVNFVTTIVNYSLL